MMQIVASMKEHGTSVLHTHEVIPVELTSEMQEEFSRIVMQGNIATTCETPGRLVVNRADDTMIVFGDMTGLTPRGVMHAATYAIAMGCPPSTVSFLQVCVRHGLYLNKYIPLLVQVPDERAKHGASATQPRQDVRG